MSGAASPIPLHPRDSPVPLHRHGAVSHDVRAQRRRCRASCAHKTSRSKFAAPDRARAKSTLCAAMPSILIASFRRGPHAADWSSYPPHKHYEDLPCEESRSRRSTTSARPEVAATHLRDRVSRVYGTPSARSISCRSPHRDVGACRLLARPSMAVPGYTLLPQRPCGPECRAVRLISTTRRTPVCRYMADQSRIREFPLVQPSRIPRERRPVDRGAVRRPFLAQRIPR